jgi:nucleoside-diphosphate-sugar epimerase
MWAYRRCYDLEVLIYRFSNVYGMYDESNRFIPTMIRKAAKNEALTVFGREKILDFTFIDDCVIGVLRSIENFDRVKDDVYNTASGEGAKLVDVARMIKENMASLSEIIVEGNRSGEVVQYIADISKANAKLCYESPTSIQEGVRKSIEWYRKWWNL